ncbi:MAG: HD domain-containing phosphohydrolase [Candidatus Omnitrophota bacterium]
MEYKIYYLTSALLSLLTATVVASLLFVLSKRRKALKPYFVLMSAVLVWAFGLYMLMISANEDMALFWSRLLHIGVVIAPIAYFYYVIKMLNIKRQKNPFFLFGVFSAIVFIFFIFTEYLLPSIRHVFSLHYYRAGVLYPLLMSYFLFYPIYSAYLIYKNYDKVNEVKKNRLLRVVVAGFFGFLGGALTVMPAYGITPFGFGPLAFYLVTCGNLFVIVSVYFGRLITATLVKKKTLLYSLIYGLSVGLFVFSVFLAQALLSSHIYLNRWIIPLVALLLITIFLRPFETMLLKLTDKVFYQRNYDYILTLKNAAKGMALIINTKKLLNIIVRIVSSHMRVSGCAIYLCNESKNSFVKEFSRGFKNFKMPHDISADSTLITWLREKEQPLNYDNIVACVEGEMLFQNRMILKRRLEQIRNAMKRMNARILIPSFLRGEMIGVLVLGSKFSGDSYSLDDTSLLTTLSNNAALAFENARMYEELNKKILHLRYLYQQEKSLFFDTASAFSYAIDTKDSYTHAHALKVAGYTAAISRELPVLMPDVLFSHEFFSMLHIAALLHDVGKIGVSDKILKKRGRLTKAEEKDLEKHTILGEQILRPISEIKEVFTLIRHHHENFDGSGYPDRLKGDKIPLISRIIAVANTYDILTSKRPYKRSVKKETALKRIAKAAGRELDPVVVDAFLKAMG